MEVKCQDQLKVQIQIMLDDIIIILNSYKPTNPLLESDYNFFIQLHNCMLEDSYVPSYAEYIRLEEIYCNLIRMNNEKMD